MKNETEEDKIRNQIKEFIDSLDFSKIKNFTYLIEKRGKKVRVYY